MTTKTSSALLVGVAALVLFGCSRQPAPAAPAAAPASQDFPDEDMSKRAHTPKPVETKAQQASKLAGYIQDKPECQQYRTALEQAEGPDGANANLEQIMADAYKAGCSK